MVGPPDPIVEKLEPRKISKEEAKRHSEKVVFEDGRTGVTDDPELEEFHEKLHQIYRSGGAEITLSRRGGGRGGGGKGGGTKRPRKPSGGGRSS